MADIDSSLPVFSLDAGTPIAISSTTDANLATNPIFTQLTDGTNVLGTTGGALDVNVTSMATSVADGSAFNSEKVFYFSSYLTNGFLHIGF